MTIRVNDIVRLLPGEEERDADIDGLVMSIDEYKKIKMRKKVEVLQWFISYCFF